MQDQIHLLSARRFMPLFLTQLLGAFNDNVFKNALVILVLYRLAEGAGLDGLVLVTVAGGLFILPFFLFSATAGQIADRYDKAMLIRRIKLAEIAVMVLGAAAFVVGDPWFLITVLFLMGIQSAFFGPLKYAILPDHLAEDELIGGNALIEMGTFLAILIGTIAGGAIVLRPNGVTWICVIVVATALAGWAGSLLISKAPPADPTLKIGLNPLTETWKILKATAAQEAVFLSILGISWFWLVGATYLTQLPAFTKDHLGANEQVLTLLLTVFSIGIGVGSLLCNKMLKGEITAKYVPFAAIGLGLFAVDLYFAASDLAPPAATLVGVDAFVRTPGNWRVLADLLLMAVCGGIFIVPLYAILQAWSDERARARAVAANNIMNALFIVGAAVATVVVLELGATVPQVFLAIAVANLAVAVLAVQLLPQEFAKALLRRQLIGARLYDVMADAILHTCNTEQTLFEALLEARTIHGGDHPVLEDIERKPISYHRMVTGCHVLGRKIAGFTEPGERVGLLLPNAVATAVTFFALQATGRVPAMLNFTAGLANMGAACRAAEVRTILTSRAFIERGNLEDVAAGLAAERTLVYLEDLRDRIGLVDKLLGAVMARLSGFIEGMRGATPEDPAVVLFTSGSEGTPKGVVLSHRNLLSNRYQLTARVDFNSADVVFNALPVFHSFGLNGGMLVPLMSGVKTFMYPSPLHYRIVPELVYDSNATIMFGTDTFLSGYARVAHAYDFYSVRYVFAGAEKVKDSTRTAWMETFGVRILEGYGATETAPVLATNTPMHFRVGTVGRLLPGIEHRLEDVPGIEEGGKLVVKGPNVMLGYLRAENPGVLEPPDGGWYDTGDIVDVDPEGYVTILGRAKRFAKIGGEMVSLGAVEAQVNDLWPGFMHAVVAVDDERKGEQLVLLTDCAEADREALSADARAKGIPELMLPKTILVRDAIPVLGTGKVDYVGVKTVVEQAMAA